MILTGMMLQMFFIAKPFIQFIYGQSTGQPTLASSAWRILLEQGLPPTYLY